MREILFRGKTKSGMWVYGYYMLTLIRGEKTHVIVPLTSHMDVTLDKEQYIIDPKTVGQYTGLKDNNGNRIFEGDIVKYADETFLVVFEQRNGSAYFGIKISNIETWNFSGSVPSSKMEVVGNIHDNPELLEMKE